MANLPTFVAKPHQRAAIDFIRTHPFCGIFLDVGLGKTATALEALYELDEPTHVLVIAPKAIAINTWPAEIAKWNFPWTVDRMVFNDRGRILPKAQREEHYESALSSRPAIHIITQDHVKALVDWMAERHTWPFGTVVIDEMQAFKNHGSERFKALRKVRAADRIGRLIGLTGTPCPNGLEDLWAEIFLMDRGWRLSASYRTYMDTFFMPTRTILTPQGGVIPTGYVPKPHADEQIQRLVSDITVSMANTTLKLPKKIVVDVPLKMNPVQEAMYRELARESILALTDKKGDVQTIEAENAAVLSGKLRQLASGAVYTNRGPYGTKLDPDLSADEFETIHTLKLDATRHITDDASGPVLVAFDFHSDALALADYFDGKRHRGESFRRRKATVFDGSPAMIDRWNRGEIELMLIQPRSAGYGLNLQAGGSTLVWYSLPWSLESYIQTNGRLHREGQRRTVTIHRLMVEETIDTEVASALSEKNRTQSNFLAAVAMESKSRTLDDALLATVEELTGTPTRILEPTMEKEEDPDE